MKEQAALTFGADGRASLDGVWDFFPGDHPPEVLDELEPQPIHVPALWEAQGYLDLDGVAWYRRRIVVDRVDGHWTLHFGAVMDIADVYVNGRLLGVHESPFTPFELDLTGALAPGENVLAVRVTDPSLDHPDHLRLPHGKQGWANQHFPSRPSLYLTYGGIWQPVTLQRHGPVVIRDVFVNSNPDDLVVTAEAWNRGREPEVVRVGVRTVGLVREEELELAPGERRRFDSRLGATPARRWRPDTPVLHAALVDAVVGGALSDSHVVRYGLRTVAVDGARVLVNGEPYRMKSALVQGFRAEELYAEGSRERIREEVLAAKRMGFNTLRLHIKAFDPVYLDVCDEIGMLLHCDIPVAEPLAYEELGDDTLLARRCVAAAREQVRRDRNHPSVILWSAMNEIGDQRREIRSWPGYERFARTLVEAVGQEDATRPVIENDWIEPDPEGVFVSPILTTHWYGRLHADYLAKIEANSARWRDCGRPFFVTEYGDWGLPDMPELPEPPFWDTRQVYAAALARTLWPGTIGRFVIETQRYQGLSDRLQTEVFRRHDHIDGYCLTELTDVPHELNGLLDLHRRPKPLAVAEVTRANQVVLPMLELGSLVVAAGEVVRAPLHVSNDGPPLSDVEIEVRFGDVVGARTFPPALAGGAADARSVVEVAVSSLPEYRATQVGEVELPAPIVPGSHDLVVRLRARGRPLSENRYPVHVVARREPSGPVRLLGDGRTADALLAVGSEVGDHGPTIVAEGGLDAEAARELRARLADGETAVVLAQDVGAGAHYPHATELRTVETRWGSSVFHFTTDESPLSSLPRRNVLVAEDSTVQARSVVVGIDGRLFPAIPVVIAFKPDPRALTGTVLGAHPAGGGRLIFCQYRLAERAATGDVAAQVLLADLVHWAAAPRPRIVRERVATDGGRPALVYSYRAPAAP